MDASNPPAAVDVDVVDQDWKVRIILWLIIAALLYILAQVLALFMTGQLFFSWWKKNDIEGLNKESQCISQFLLMAYAQGSSALLYDLVRLMVGKQKGDLSSDMLFFITRQLLITQRITDSNGDQSGILTPTALCQYVLLEVGQGDKLFDNWIQHFNVDPPGNIPISQSIFNTKAEMLWDNGKDRVCIWTDKTSGSTYKFYRLKAPTVPNDTWGLYPSSSTDTNSWAALILCWANNITYYESTRLSDEEIKPGDNCKIAYVLGKDTRKTSTAIWTMSSQKAPKGRVHVEEAWFTGKNSVNFPHNFLGRYGINISAPFVEAYISNNWVGKKGDPVYFKNLINGGWVASLKGAGGDSNQITYDALTTEVFGMSDSKVTIAPPGSICNPGAAQKAVGFFGGFLSTFLGIAILGLMGPEGWGIAIGIGAGAAGTLAGLKGMNSCT